ncbi:hypothetical protein ACFL5O_10870, partial [Myxococcota bacterium]
RASMLSITPKPGAVEMDTRQLQCLPVDGRRNAERQSDPPLQGAARGREVRGCGLPSRGPA